MKPNRTAGLAVAAAVLVAGPAGAGGPDKADVASFYADIALAGYEDSLLTARALHSALEALVASPDQATLDRARAAWIAAREPYQQTEVYRFGNAHVDAWEGRVNAWPLDEGLIDYVDVSYGAGSDQNLFRTVNVIANPTLKIGGQPIDARHITPALLSETLHEIGAVEANVATGYHAIEFLLWGQDLNGTGPGAGDRPFTDFDPANCTGGHCERRIDYLRALGTLLVDDLQEMVAAWGEGGEARTALLATGGDAAMAAILTGMGSLSYGELAGERMKLGLLLHDPEEEHDCFSDNTHHSHYFNIVGIRNVYHGRYRRVDGTVIEGPALADLLAAADGATADALAAKLDATHAAAQIMVRRAGEVEAWDQMIGEGNAEGNAVVQAVIDALVDQTGAIDRAVAALGLDRIAFEGSDSLDNPDAVFQ